MMPQRRKKKEKGKKQTGRTGLQPEANENDDAG